MSFLFHLNLIILSLISIITYFIFLRPQYNNYIIAKYYFDTPVNETKLFDDSFLNSIKSMKIDEESVSINNIQNFNEKGDHTIELHFKNKLTSLDSLFFKVNSLTEVDLSNLYSTSIKTASDMFNGCSNLKEVIFKTFNPSKIYNISNMFSGCSL